MIYYYRLLYLLLLLLSLPFAAFMVFFNKRAFNGIHERLGIYPSSLKAKLSLLDRPIWIHAASLGEVRLLKSISGFEPGSALITTTSDAGKLAARRFFPEAVSIYMPLDLPFLYARLIRLAQPSKLIILETEIWPVLVSLGKNMPVTIFNGRLSDEKIKLYRFIRKPLKSLLKNLDAVYAAGSENYSRFLEIGISEKKLHLLPNLKYNYSPPPKPEGDPRYLSKKTRFIVCGSTHPGEEEILASVFKELLEDFENIALILSPRKIERTSEIESLLESLKIPSARWSQMKNSPDLGTCAIIDTIGELTAVYGLAEIAFIGGSLIPHGGHNMIEAAACGVPVVTGLFNNNFKDIAEYLIEEGGLFAVSGEKELYNKMKFLLSDWEVSASIGRKNIQALKKKKKEVEVLLEKWGLF